MTDTTRFHGYVKFFDDKKAYGFIVGLDTCPADKDIFVHITDLRPEICYQPTLYTGEYVRFDLETVTRDDGVVQYKAHNVKGAFDGALLCDHGRITFESYSRYNWRRNAGASDTTTTDGSAAGTDDSAVTGIDDSAAV